MWQSRSVGRNVEDTYPHARSLVARTYSTPGESLWAKELLHVRGMSLETVSMSYNKHNSGNTIWQNPWNSSPRRKMNQKFVPKSR